MFSWFPPRGKKGNLNKGFDAVLNDSGTHTPQNAVIAAPAHSDLPLSQFNNRRQLDLLIPTRAAAAAAELEQQK